MPKATMNEDYFPPRTKNNVGTTWQVLSVESVAIAEPVQKLTDPYLGTSVFGTDTSHVLRALLSTKLIHHPLGTVRRALER